MQYEDLLAKTCVIGVSYFDHQGTLLKQTQFAGEVMHVDRKMGITIKLRHSDPMAKEATFILPPNLEAWFIAPPGRYRHAEAGVDIENPDYLVTWNVFRSAKVAAEGQHEWWEWVPNTTSPQVGQVH